MTNLERAIKDGYAHIIGEASRKSHMFPLIIILKIIVIQKKKFVLNFGPS